MYKRKLFRRFLSAKPLKSADSAGWLPDKNLVKTLRSKKRDIPHLKPKKATRSRLKKASMEKFKCEKRNRKLTRKAKRARVKFITEDSSSTNSAEENQFRPGNLNLKLGLNLNVKPYNPTKTLPRKAAITFIRLCVSPKLGLRCLHLEHRAPSKSPLKRSHMDRDTTYIVNLDTDRPAAPAQLTQSDLPTLSVTINASDDMNNNDVITGMEPTERSQRRNDAIDAMELAGGRSSPTDSPFASTSCASLSQPVAAYALLPTPLRQEIGNTEAHSLALAAIANVLASEQLDRFQPHPAEPHSPTHHPEATNPDPMVEDSHAPRAAPVNDRLSVTILDDTVFEHDTAEIEIEAEAVESQSQSEAEPDNDEVIPLHPLNSLSPTTTLGPFTPTVGFTSDISPPWTPNPHPCQAPLFVAYNECRHDYTRSDERICYDVSATDCSPSTPCNPREMCSPGCFNPKRCLHHYPFTFGCNVCMESGWHPPYHPNQNLTPEFIRVAPNYPNDKRPAYAICETGRYAPITRMFSPFPASSQQVWVDASPSSTASSDIERHEEIERQAVNQDTSTTPSDLSTMFQEDIDNLVDNWSLEQIRKGNVDEEFLNADRNKRKELMSMGKYDTGNDTDEMRRLRHVSEADSDIEICFISNGNVTGPWVPMPRNEKVAMRTSKRSARSKRAKSRRKTAVPPTCAGNILPTPVTPSVKHTKASHHPTFSKISDRSLHTTSFKENAANTPVVDGSILTHKIVTPYQETVETPPIIYSVVENGKDYTEILKDLVVKGIKYTRMEAVWTGSSDLSMERKLRDVEDDYDGVVKRQDYLENMHHLFLSGIAARDASVTDYTTADDTLTPAPPTPHVPTPPAVAPLVVYPPVKSAEDVAMSVTALRKEANRLILEADRLTEANEAAAETTALLIREAEKIIDAMESKLEDEPMRLISQGLKQAEALLQQKTPIRATTPNKPKLTMVNTPVPGSDAEGSPINTMGSDYHEAVDRGVAIPSPPYIVFKGQGGSEMIDLPPTDEAQRAKGAGSENLSTNLSEYFTPAEEPMELPKLPLQNKKAQLPEYKAPTPSRSFSNISRVEKIVDPLDPLVFSQLTLTCSYTYSLTDLGGESAEKKRDADYIPSYSNLATSESDISIVTGMSEDARSRLGSMSLAGYSRDTVQRYTEDIIRKPSLRRASVQAKAHIRDQLISEKDKKDASYNGGETRKDTPQVSPSIPLNPGTPISNGGWQRPFVPTNNLVLTRPVFHFSGDDELDIMVRNFNSSAATSTASLIRAPLQELKQGFKPTRRSFLRPMSRPVPPGQSTYPPSHGLKTWRIYTGSPTKLVAGASGSSKIGNTAGGGDGNGSGDGSGDGDGNGNGITDGDEPVKPVKPVIEILSSTSSVTEI